MGLKRVRKVSILQIREVPYRSEGHFVQEIPEKVIAFDISIKTAKTVRIVEEWLVFFSVFVTFVTRKVFVFGPILLSNPDPANWTSWMMCTIRHPTPDTRVPIPTTPYPLPAAPGYLHYPSTHAVPLHSRYQEGLTECLQISVLDWVASRIAFSVYQFPVT